MPLLLPTPSSLTYMIPLLRSLLNPIFMQGQSLTFQISAMFHISCLLSVECLSLGIMVHPCDNGSMEYSLCIVLCISWMCGHTSILWSQHSTSSTIPSIFQFTVKSTRSQPISPLCLQRSTHQQEVYIVSSVVHSQIVLTNFQDISLLRFGLFSVHR